MMFLPITGKLLGFSCGILLILTCFNEASESPKTKHKVHNRNKIQRNNALSKNLQWDNHDNQVELHQLKEQVKKHSDLRHDSSELVSHTVKSANNGNKEKDDCQPLMTNKKESKVSNGHKKISHDHHLSKTKKGKITPEMKIISKGVHYHFNHTKIHNHHLRKAQHLPSKMLFNNLKDSGSGLVGNKKLNNLLKTASGRKLPKNKIKKLKKTAEKKKLVPKLKAKFNV
ncbi:uncharacterized protein LOC111087470 [Limulus polyphemus]|uniref:Uncharacterized protein LOC111087470 n=1 Tax=Limulus polyphemus TaxID=6850 RepID=A0ABM1T206_LIMPO|nr:uncharacterized protein LOC111087470 [Limulus polyphemus]